MEDLYTLLSFVNTSTALNECSNANMLCVLCNAACCVMLSCCNAVCRWRSDVLVDRHQQAVNQVCCLCCHACMWVLKYVHACGCTVLVCCKQRAASRWCGSHHQTLGCDTCHTSLSPPAQLTHTQLLCNETTSGGARAVPAHAAASPTGL